MIGLSCNQACDYPITATLICGGDSFQSHRLILRIVTDLYRYRDITGVSLTVAYSNDGACITLVDACDNGFPICNLRVCGFRCRMCAYPADGQAVPVIIISYGISFNFHRFAGLDFHGGNLGPCFRGCFKQHLDRGVFINILQDVICGGIGLIITIHRPALYPQSFILRVGGKDYIRIHLHLAAAR